MSHCQDPVTCPNGNCEGCKDGVLWCQDPRCQPYCPECSIPKDHDFAVWTMFLIIVLILIALIAIMLFAYGPKIFYHSKQKEIE